MPVAALPVEVWLIVLAAVDDVNFLWSTCRSISRAFRDRVEFFFRGDVIRDMLVDLHYTDIHGVPPPQLPRHIHIPMVFSGFSDDGSMALFQQRSYLHSADRYNRIEGSICGWVPFLERYLEETEQKAPMVLKKSKSDISTPSWKREYKKQLKVRAGQQKTDYLWHMSKMTAVGRGDRPPFYIRLYDMVNDTDLVNVVVDCKERGIAFNWKRTFSLFFREQEFVAHASRSPARHVYGGQMDEIAAKLWTPLVLPDTPGYYAQQARRKRLLPWSQKNMKRISPEIRWLIEQQVSRGRTYIRLHLCHENLGPFTEGESKELVPEKLAADRPELLKWPFSTRGFERSQDKKVLTGILLLTVGCVVQ